MYGPLNGKKKMANGEKCLMNGAMPQITRVAQTYPKLKIYTRFNL